MAEQELRPNYSSPHQDVDASIAGKSLLFYWRSGWLFIVVVVVARLVGIMLALSTYVRWGIIAVVFALYTWWLIKRYRIALSTTVTAGIIAGVVSGLLITVFELVWYHEWWYILNFIRQPVITGAIGGVAGFIVYILTSLFSQRTSKGGGLYGRAETR